MVALFPQGKKKALKDFLKPYHGTIHASKNMYLCFHSVYMAMVEVVLIIKVVDVVIIMMLLLYAYYFVVVCGLGCIRERFGCLLSHK